MIYKIAAWFPRKPAAYLFLLISWAAALWFLSSGNHAPKESFQILHIDKVYHFTYFLAGGALSAFSLGLQWLQLKNLHLFSISVIICSIIGRLDEYHQGFTPGRSGNDTGDWLADTLGGATGAAFIIYFILPHLLAHITNRAKADEKRS